MEWPQITMIILMTWGGAIHAAKHGQSQGNYSFGIWLIAAALNGWILHEGGFW